MRLDVLSKKDISLLENIDFNIKEVEKLIIEFSEKDEIVFNFRNKVIKIRTSDQVENTGSLKPYYNYFIYDELDCDIDSDEETGGACSGNYKEAIIMAINEASKL